MRRILLACLVLAFAFTKLADSASAATPTLLTAVRYNTNLYELFLTFSAKLDGTNGYDPANYAIKSGKITLDIQDIYPKLNEKLGSSSNVIIRVNDEIAMNSNWVVSVTAGVTDNQGNAITATNLPITSTEYILESGDLWYYADSGAYGWDGNQFYDNSWAQPSFDPTVPNVFGQDTARPAPFAVAAITGINPGWTLCCWNTDTDTAFTSSTYYFRVFNDAAPTVTGDIFGGTFLMRLIVDDGVVVYVNGREAYRFNYPASVTNPTYTNYASASHPSTTFDKAVVIPSAFFLPGRNLIAAEVHTSGASDRTATFDLELVHQYTNLLGGPIVITKPPQSTNVVEGATAMFDVQHQGNPPYTYEWYTNSVKVVGATNRLFVLNRVSAALNNTTVFAKVKGTGAGSTQVTSANATLTVTPDTTAPNLLSASFDDANDRILVTVSERLATPGATNAANWGVTNAAGVVVPISSVTPVDANFSSFYLNTTTVLKGNTRYYVFTKNLTDTAATPNKLASNVVVSIAGNFPLIDMNDTWDFYQLGTNPPVAATWMNKDFVKSADWQTGQAVFANTFSPIPDPGIPNQYLDLAAGDNNWTITYYFRKQFTLGPTNGIKLNVRQIVDDGIVVWLNGQIAYTDNMPSGTISYTNLASTAVTTIPLKTKTLPLTNIVVGVNQLAVEVHQKIVADADVAFGLELTEVIPSVVTTNIVNQNPVVTITAPTAGAVVPLNTAVAVTANVTDDGTIAKVELFEGATLIGSDTSAPYSINYTPTTSGAHTLKVVATDNLGATGEATVSITGNAKPVVTITSPANGVLVALNVALPVTATVTDDGTIAKVELFEGATLIGSDTTSPYSINYTPTTSGAHALKVVATDNNGATGEATVTINGNAKPTVVITAPTAGATVTVGDVVAVNSTVTDDGTVSKVELFEGATLIGSDTTAPYSINYTASAAGAHSLKVVATDSLGATGEATVSITANEAVRPTLVIAKSGDGKNINITWTQTAGYSLQVATKLAPAPDWTAVSGAGANSYSVPVSGITGPRYYRLFKP
jgi:hypothetical protein